MQDPISSPPPEGTFAIPQSSVFESLIACSATCAQELAKLKDGVILREVFGGMLSLLNGIVNRLAAPAIVAWDPAEWLGTLLQSMEYEVRLKSSSQYL